MSLCKPTPLNVGDIKAVVYDFAKAGDILPKHNHNELTAHITIVARGRLKAYSHDWETVLESGQCVDFPAGQPHEFMALDDNTRIYNITKLHDGHVNDSTAAEVEDETSMDLKQIAPSVHYI